MHISIIKSPILFGQTTEIFSMSLLRSIFWLSVAFVVIGPQIDYSASISAGSEAAILTSQQFVSSQTDITNCSSIECVGGKIALSAGVQTVSELAQSMTHLSSASTPLVIPIPRPRLARTS